MQKEYLVTVKDPAEFDGLHSELLEDRSRGHFLAQKLNGSNVSIANIPDRPVELINYRPGSLRTAHYLLSDAEAADLRQDSRVLSVEPHIKHTPNIKVTKFAQQAGIFNKGTSLNNSFLNWGLKSCTSEINPFTDTQLSGTYPYVLEGEHVDIVLVDSGITPDHPEFKTNPDGTGVSRVKQIDWYTETGIPGTMPANHYRDEDGHGTHCAGIAAGNRHGWAKKANIYSIKAIVDWGIDAIDIYDVFDLIRVWHTNKPVNPVTGRRNPTIVNNSWGFLTYSYGNVTEFGHRNNVYNKSNFTTTERSAYGLVNYSFYYGGNVHGVRVSSIDAEIADCIAAGVIVVGAAGNYYHKVDVPGGVDYDNYYLDFFGGNYYHRGATPSATPGVICVGNIDSVNPEQKSVSSECGPRVDIYAPGTNIMSPYSTGVSDPRSNSHYLAKLSGTSMSSPQVVGALALILQFKPWMTPTQSIKILNNSSVTNRISDIGTMSYTNYRSLQGGANKYLFMEYTGGENGENITVSANITTNLT
jgi:hypothetical protein